MALQVETTLGAMTGARYIESLRDGREVWLDGEKVADVTKHPATDRHGPRTGTDLRPATLGPSTATR